AFTTPTARGSSVFALSEHGATSAAARRLAQRENEADLIGGVNLNAMEPVLARTWLDMSQTAQISGSLRVGRSVLDGIGAINTLHKGSVEQAGFAVLKAPDIPSIPVETAFISNPDEEQKLRDEGYQRKFAASMRSGIKLVPSPDETRGNVVKAFIVLAPGHEPSYALEEEIQRHVRQFLAPYEYPKEIEFIDALPMTTTGKVQRRRSDDRARGCDSRVSGAVETQVSRALHRHRRRPGAEHHSRHQLVLPRPVEPGCIRFRASVPVASADHARCAHRLAAMGAYGAAPDALVRCCRLIGLSRDAGCFARPVYPPGRCMAAPGIPRVVSRRTGSRVADRALDRGYRPDRLSRPRQGRRAARPSAHHRFDPQADARHH
ncbi:MAG: hypothetical protein E6H64_16310, partial [Betaproteobacteria bacterium]